METIVNSTVSSTVASGLVVAAKKAGLCCAVVLGSILTGHAQGQPEPVNVMQADAASLRLRISNPHQKAARLRVVRLENGQALVDEIHRTPAYGTLLKFGGLPTGDYAVSLRVGPNRYRYVVQVATPAPGNTAIAVRETTTHRVERGLVSGEATAAL